jgi:3-oxoacyl-[acyl-carrier protein] reductase
MSHSLAGRVFLVLGAGGIGYALAKRLLARHATVHIVGRDAAALAIAEGFGAHVHRVADATASGTIATCFETIHAICGRLDGVANCIGSVLLKPALSTSEDEFAQVIATNLGTAFATVRGGAKWMREHGGSLVLVSSAAAQIGLANHEAIAAAKAGVEGLMRSAATTYAPMGLRVNCVAPGLVQTKLTARITQSESALKMSLGMHALGRIGQPDDVASAIEWLLDPEQSWTSGQVIGVDGGLARLRRP